MEYQNWGRIDYGEAWLKQKDLVEKRIANLIPDTIVFCEHNPVITLGRSSQRDLATGNLSSGVLLNPAHIPVYEVERGGHATYHGPGQLVIYPILKLLNKRNENPMLSGVHGLIRSLEIIVSTFLKKKYFLNSNTVKNKTGVWIDEKRKIASIGISAKKWVSYHGCALNLFTDKNYWNCINPCGFNADLMTDILSETNQRINFEQAAFEIREYFERFSKASNSELAILPRVGERIL